MFYYVEIVVDVVIDVLGNVFVGFMDVVIWNFIMVSMVGFEELVGIIFFWNGVMLVLL